MSWPLMEKLLRYQLSVCSSEGCCVDRLNSPGHSSRASRKMARRFLTHHDI